jgi:oligopeptide/dipeptide ABC transporter ATP-binding protein
MQDPLTSLSPVFSIGDQIVETIRNRRHLRPHAAREQAVELLAAVGLPDPRRRISDYPHQLSGGMRQRVAIALALACEPALLIADEPTTALDVTIRAQVIELLLQLSDERGMAILLITHDFGMLAGFAEWIAVMYAGRIVEQGPVDALYAAPTHPYTAALLASQPRISGARHLRLDPIPGHPPDPARRPGGCPFHPRCAVGFGRPRCANETPLLRPMGELGQLTACHYAEELLLRAGVRTGAAVAP